MRKVIRYDIAEEGRDKGKVFEITEFSAVQAHNWAVRCIFAMLNNGDIGIDDMQNQGMALMATMGISSIARLHPDRALPLLNELMDCVKIVPNPSKPVTRGLVDEDFEEWMTIFTLQKEVLSLHINFSIPAEASTSESQTSETPLVDS